MATIPEPGTQFVPSSHEAIRDQMLADYRLEMLRIDPAVEPAVQPETDVYVWATWIAAAQMLLYSNVALSRDAVTPLNATGQDLEDWRLALGLPEVKPGPSSGKIRLSVTGTSSVPDGEPFVFPNGLRGQVLGSWGGVTDGSEIDVVSTDVGLQVNFPADTEVRFVNPPAGVNEVATVSKNDPLTGGTDVESEERKRNRVLSAIPNKPGGGNWAQFRQLSNDALPSIQDTFVYQAPGGPASVLVVPLRDFDDENTDYSRVPSDAALAVIENAIRSNMPDAIEIVIGPPADVPTDVAIQVDIPASTLDGGSGEGWLDTGLETTGTLWPKLEVADGGRIAITAVNGSTITVNAATTDAPVAGQTRIAWWSSDDMRFRTFLVTASSGSTTAWVLVLDRPPVSSNGVAAVADEYVCPAAASTEAYGKSWLDGMRGVGPGQITDDTDRLPRSRRYPLVEDEWPTSLTFKALKDFQNNHPEISEIEWSYRSVTTPAVPADVSVPPNVLVPRHFAIYPTIA